MEMIYRIQVYLKESEKPLTYSNIKKFSIKDGFVIFKDTVTGIIKHFPKGKVTIDEDYKGSNNNGFKGGSNANKN